MISHNILKYEILNNQSLSNWKVSHLCYSVLHKNDVEYFSLFNILSIKGKKVRWPL